MKKQMNQLVLHEGGKAKRVNIVSLKMVKESSMLYKDRRIQTPEDDYNLMKDFLGDAIVNILGIELIEYLIMARDMHI